eukprot:jgi/Botrbrau1/1182/Bobra.0162s0064.1
MRCLLQCSLSHPYSHPHSTHLTLQCAPHKHAEPGHLKTPFVLQSSGGGCTGEVDLGPLYVNLWSAGRFRII